VVEIRPVLGFFLDEGFDVNDLEFAVCSKKISLFLLSGTWNGCVSVSNCVEVCLRKAGELRTDEENEG
jgi:hypothetical protein